MFLLFQRSIMSYLWILVFSTASAD